MIVIIGLFIMALIVYYAYIALWFFAGNFRFKKQFLLSLIPFQFFIMSAIEKFKNLD